MIATRAAGRGRRRRRRDTLPPRQVIAWGAAGLVLLGLATLVALRSPNGLPFVDYTTVYGSVRDPGNLQPHSDVRVGGVRVGQVIDVRSEGNRARIEIKLTPDAGVIPADSTLSVRAAGLLGARYVEIHPGGAAATVADGAVLRGGPDALRFGVPEALETFDASTRGALGDLIVALGGGLAGQGAALNDAIAAAPYDGRDFPRVVDAVLDRPGAARRLLPSLAAAAKAGDGARDELVDSLAAAADGLGPFAEEREDLDAMLTALPPTLRTARPALDEGRALVEAATRLARSSAENLPAAPGGLRATTALLKESPEPLRRTRQLLATVRPAVPDVLRMTSALKPVLAPLAEVLDDAGPLARDLGARGCDIDNMAENWRSALGYGIPSSGQDTPLPSGSIGPLGFFRITLLAGAESIQGVSRPSPGTQNGVRAYLPPCAVSPGGPYEEPGATR